MHMFIISNSFNGHQEAPTSRLRERRGNEPPVEAGLSTARAPTVPTEERNAVLITKFTYLSTY